MKLLLTSALSSCNLAALVVFQSAISNVDGVTSVQRIVCGGCLDFKVIVSLPIEKFKTWVSQKDLIQLFVLSSIVHLLNVQTAV